MAAGLREPVSQRPTFLGFRQVVQDHDRTRPGLRFGAWAIVGLPIGQYTATALRHGIERARITTGLAPRLLHQLELCDGLLGIAHPVYPTRTQAGG